MFSVLRNLIAHDDAVDLDEKGSFDGYHHARHAEEVSAERSRERS
jgi:hypothetical protein